VFPKKVERVELEVMSSAYVIFEPGEIAQEEY